MDRLTTKNENGYTVSDIEASVKRLGCFEDMYESLENELADTVSKMEKLKAEGKIKSVTYNQLFANKLTVMNIISRIEVYLSQE